MEAGGSAPFCRRSGNARRDFGHTAHYLADGGARMRPRRRAQSLSTESNRLKLEVGKFLNSVRAA
jgi:hypothetical protein